MPKMLIIGRSPDILFHADQESSLDVDQSVEVSEEIVDRVGRQDVHLRKGSCIVLRDKSDVAWVR